MADCCEKPQSGEGWIDGGLFVIKPGVFDDRLGDMTVPEEDPLESLARGGQLMAYKHYGFWHCIDTLRDRNYLHAAWWEGRAQG